MKAFTHHLQGQNSITTIVFFIIISIFLNSCRKTETADSITNSDIAALEKKYEKFHLKIRPMDKNSPAKKLRPFSDLAQLDKYLSTLKTEPETIKIHVSETPKTNFRVAGSHTYGYHQSDYLHYLNISFLATINYESNGYTNTITSASDVLSYASDAEWTSSAILYEITHTSKYTHLQGEGNTAGSGSIVYLNWYGDIDETETGRMLGWSWEISRTTYQLSGSTDKNAY